MKIIHLTPKQTPDSRAFWKGWEDCKAGSFTPGKYEGKKHFMNMYRYGWNMREAEVSDR